jgi:hypothetical protein
MIGIKSTLLDGNATARRSYFSLDDMSCKLAVVIQAVAVMAALGVPVAALVAATNTSTLVALRDAFAIARALPRGSRPSPPDLEPTELINSSLATLEAYLGRSTRLDCDDLLTRPAETCASFTYGPGPAPPIKVAPDSVTVTTGGPWLLVAGLSKGRVVDARWLGQK